MESDISCLLRADKRIGANKSELQLSTQHSLSPSFTSTLGELVYSQVCFHTAFLARKTGILTCPFCLLSLPFLSVNRNKQDPDEV